MTEAPDLFSYLDYRLYLGDWFTWRKLDNPRFSHRMFARLAGFRSPSLLHLVIKGERNITSRTLQSFIKALALDKEAAQFFSLLVELETGRDAEQKNLTWQRISATRRFQDARHIDGEAFRYLSRWYYPAIRELASCHGFRPDAAWIARKLQPKITTQQAEDALGTLFELGLLVDNEGTVTATDQDAVTPHEVLGLAVHNYHLGMLTRAMEAIEGVRPPFRHLGAVTVAIPRGQVPALKRELAAFQERILHLCDGAGADQVYQVNLQLFPLSAPTDEVS